MVTFHQGKRALFPFLFPPLPLLDLQTKQELPMGKPAVLSGERVLSSPFLRKRSLACGWHPHLIKHVYLPFSRHPGGKGYSAEGTRPGDQREARGRRLSSAPRTLSDPRRTRESAWELPVEVGNGATSGLGPGNSAFGALHLGSTFPTPRLGEERTACLHCKGWESGPRDEVTGP